MNITVPQSGPSGLTKLTQPSPSGAVTLHTNRADVFPPDFASLLEDAKPHSPIGIQSTEVSDDEAMGEAEELAEQTAAPLEPLNLQSPSSHMPIRSEAFAVVPDTGSKAQLPDKQKLAPPTTLFEMASRTTHSTLLPQSGSTMPKSEMVQKNQTQTPQDSGIPMIGSSTIASDEAETLRLRAAIPTPSAPSTYHGFARNMGDQIPANTPATSPAENKAAQRQIVQPTFDQAATNLRGELSQEGTPNHAVPATAPSQPVSLPGKTQMTAQVAVHTTSAPQKPPLQPPPPEGLRRVEVLSPSDIPEVIGWDLPRAAIAHQFAYQPQATDIAPQVARQLIEVVAQAQHRPVEIALSPAELGRVRMSVTTDDGKITVSILAERPDTLDLMRRHIDQLGQAFRSIGYDQITFSFGQGTDSGGQSNTASTEQPSGEATSDSMPSEQNIIHLDHAGNSGVDIRL